MAFTRTNPYQQYKQTEVESLSQGKLIVMLYDGAIRFLKDAIQYADDFRKYDEVHFRNHIKNRRPLYQRIINRIYRFHHFENYFK